MRATEHGTVLIDKVVGEQAIAEEMPSGRGGPPVLGLLRCASSPNVLVMQPQGVLKFPFATSMVSATPFLFATSLAFATPSLCSPESLRGRARDLPPLPCQLPNEEHDYDDHGWVSSELRHAAEQSALGVDYALGKSGPKNVARALELFRKACGAHHPGGCNNLAVLYHRGQGVPRNDAQAGALLERSCTARNATACFNLGLMLERKPGDPQAYLAFHKSCRTSYGRYEAACRKITHEAWPHTTTAWDWEAWQTLGGGPVWGSALGRSGVDGPRAHVTMGFTVGYRYLYAAAGWFKLYFNDHSPRKKATVSDDGMIDTSSYYARTFGGYLEAGLTLPTFLLNTVSETRPATVVKTIGVWPSAGYGFAGLKPVRRRGEAPIGDYHGGHYLRFQLGFFAAAGHRGYAWLGFMPSYQQFLGRRAQTLRGSLGFAFAFGMSYRSAHW